LHTQNYSRAADFGNRDSATGIGESSSHPKIPAIWKSIDEPGIEDIASARDIDNRDLERRTIDGFLSAFGKTAFGAHLNDDDVGILSQGIQGFLSPNRLFNSGRSVFCK
jgi:hypothetical protein